MITPAFTVEQDAEFVRVLITAPLLNLAAVDFAVDGAMFKFVSHPYFLRLRFPGELTEDGRESCTYDSDTGVVIAALPKKVPGEVFEGLDLLTTLLARKPPTRPAGPLIEVIGETPAEPTESATDPAEFDWEVEQAIPEEAEAGAGADRTEHGAALETAGYGFAQRYSGTLGKICDEVPGVIELRDPDHASEADRKAQRLATEDERFDAEHYACDHAERNEPGTLIHEALHFAPLWAEWPETVPSATAGEAARGCAFTAAEAEEMRRLPRKEYLVDSVKAELIALVDIVYAWAYNHRVTQGEHTVESAWTVATVSATLSFLARHSTVYEAVVASLRRAVAYPLVRSFALATLVLEDTKAIFRLGLRGVLKCLLDARTVLLHDEVKRYLADLYLTDCCVWLQTLPEKAISALSTKLDAIEVSAAELGWPLGQIEAIVDADDDDSHEEGVDSGPDSDESTDSDDVSSNESDESDDREATETADSEATANAPTGQMLADAADDLMRRGRDDGEVVDARGGTAPAEAERAVVPWRFANPWIDTRQLPTREMTLCGTLVVVHQQVGADIDVHHNTGLILWDASYVLARFMEVRLGPGYFCGKRVIELGAGTGLPSIVAALLGGVVVATDLDEALPLLRTNIGEATATTPELDVSVERVVWSADLVHPQAPFDVVVCSEIIYDRGCHEALLSCLLALAGPATEIFFAYKRRGLGEDDFVQRLRCEHRVTDVPQTALEHDFQGARIHLLRVRLLTVGTCGTATAAPPV